jgi:hypothetical protein
MASANSIGLLFRIKGDSTEGVEAIRDVKEESTELSESTTDLSSTFTDLATAGAVVGAGLIAMGAIALNVTKQIFTLTRSAAEFGEEIFNVRQQTGLGAETISSLKFAAEESGSSLDEITDGLKEFAKTVKEAADGSDKAREKLKAIGVTSTDLEQALKQALATIVKVPPGIEQMAAAEKAFGDEGVKLLPFIKSFDGDLVKLTAKAKSLGLTLTDEGATAANEFADQMKLLSAQVDAAGRVIGFAFMPVFLDMATQVSGWLVKNQGELEMWASRLARIFQNAIRGLQEVIDFVTNNEGKIRIVIGILTLGASEALLFSVRQIMDAVDQDFQQYQQNLAKQPKAGGSSVSEIPGAPLGDELDLRADKKKKQRDDAARKAAAAAREADRQARQDRQADLATEQTNLETIQRTFRATVNDLVKLDSVKGYISGWNAEMAKFQANLQTSLEYIEEQERSLLEAGASESEKNALAAQQQERRRKLEEEFAKFRDDSSAKFWAAQDQAYQDAWNWQRKIWDIEKARLETARKIAEQTALSTIVQPTLENTGMTGPEEQEGSIFDAWTASWDNFMERISEDAPTLKSIIGDVAGFIQNAFYGFAQALGSVVEQWVLTGETGPAVMRQILASALAAIAAEAAVRAVFELAMGFAALFLNPAEAAAHFTAAALFGSIAVGSALVGRAIAPKQEGKRAFSGATSSGQSRSDQANQSPISRVSDRAFESRRANPFNHAAEVMARAAASIQKTMGNLEPLSPGEVLSRGTQERRGLIADTLNREIESNAGFGMRLRRAQGLT